MILDTESRQSTEGERELHELRCWVLRVIVRPDKPGQLMTCSQSEGLERDTLAPAVQAAIRSGESWRLFTHNLSFDLGLTRLPLVLMAAGWEIGRHNLASDQPWAHLSRKSKSLWLCDSWSWLPLSVEAMGELLGMTKPKLPTEADSDETWLRRCRADVEITSTGLLRLLAEWDERKLGWWSITGPASGWNTLLHFPRRSNKTREAPNVTHNPDPYAHTGQQKTLIVPDPEARAFERQALFSGRRDLWRVGNLGLGPWAEVDLRNAHLTICARLPLPYRRWAGFDSLPLDDWRLCTTGAGLVARVIVRTRTPRYPLRHSGTVIHPVGRFQTTLAGPEILDALRRGELESIGPGFGYHLGSQHREWAEWCLAILATTDGSIEPMLQVAVKSWGRSVPGRWGMTHARPIKSGPSHVQDWELEPITLGDPPRRGSIFHLAGTWTEYVNDQEADDSFPAVLAYVQSYCRLALNAMLDALPEDCLVSCNTEGAWVHVAALDSLGHLSRGPAGSSRSPLELEAAGLDLLSSRTAPLTVRVKQTTEHLKVLSPQHHLTDQARLYSGIPRAAVEVGKDQFEFLTWPKLRGQIERGDPRGYVREKRTVSLAGVPVSRWSFEDGYCSPVEVTYCPESGNAIQPPDPDLERHHGPLRASQHPVLRRALSPA
jgi:hypothetical protein